MQRYEADSLVMGAEVVGGVFVNTLHEETYATLIVVDRHHQPGGHCNDAYPFLRL